VTAISELSGSAKINSGIGHAGIEARCTAQGKLAIASAVAWCILLAWPGRCGMRRKPHLRSASRQDITEPQDRDIQHFRASPSARDDGPFYLTVSMSVMSDTLLAVAAF
jgi:hypothetical protein